MSNELLASGGETGYLSAVVRLSNIGGLNVRLPELLRRLSPAIVLFAAMAFAVLPHGAPLAAVSQITESENRQARNGDLPAKRIVVSELVADFLAIVAFADELTGDQPVDIPSVERLNIHGVTPTTGQPRLEPSASSAPAHRDRARGPPLA